MKGNEGVRDRDASGGGSLLEEDEVPVKQLVHTRIEKDVCAYSEVPQSSTSLIKTSPAWSPGAVVNLLKIWSTESLLS
jgi:hypothetical protein